MAIALPPELLAGLCAEGGGRIAIVVGAGSSFEAPTSLPLAHQCAEDAHRRLVTDGVLEDGECETPGDLSAVADTVYEKTGRQREVVQRLPMVRFTNATPNDGHYIAAALLREHAVVAFLTLNFDLAVGHALAAVGAGDEVVTAAAPHHDLGAINVVYLHGNVNSEEDLILRSAQLDEAWRDGWQELIATRVMTVPIVVFAGLGSPASVLIESIRRVRQALPTHTTIHVDPEEQGSSAFSEAVAVQPEHFVQSGWVDFMLALGVRLTQEHVAHLAIGVQTLIAEQGYEPEDCTSILASLENLGLVALGRLRAYWLLDESPYLPARLAPAHLLGMLIYGLCLVGRLTESELDPQENGNLDVRKQGRLLGILVPASGGGVHSWPTVQAKLRTRGRLTTGSGLEPIVALVAGVQGDPPDIVPPEDLVAEPEEHDIVAPRQLTVFLRIDDVRLDAAPLLEVLS